MAKMKTHKATAKRFKLSAKKKLIHKICGQNHFNAREPGKVTRAKRLRLQIAKVDEKAFKALIPYC
ncbi:MAG: Uncharacterized protein G01um101418_877 [Parcubacteria group bacterium Gr01-1014_18]|nr:MAG: Uncharacterized protein Greene041636_837 [Parcubacteria group bacterium Greene0416_36]TSC79878.1 MAG: Uncharacterized protein G01um101418_877 [Parcubacteria group bacterium Gr01-1014_18]TSC98310.1 MAG: Uncharacterized protein Greene101420_814 [Parcubacteria group bacterium Greene1014_20]TSD06649.1 MAG: Uncharacterized protein Greene07142_701 [Parcubacteria group bacterium Greene0714_2]